jgi:DNA-binding GntR family transcriptional regulator
MTIQTTSQNLRPASDVSGNGVYERVKARIIANTIPAGRRILVEPLADQFFVSSTPVREALIRLSAERVINDVPKAGFFAKEITENEIEGLFALQQLVLDWTLSVMEDDARGSDARENQSHALGILKPPDLLDRLDQTKSISPRTAVAIIDALFGHISRQSGNGDVIHMVGNINDRTHFVRQHYFEVFDDAQETLVQLCRAYHGQNFAILREDLRAHFHDMMDRLPGLLKIVRGHLLRTSA